MEWKKFENELPPLGKRVVVTRPGCRTLGISTLFYAFVHEEDKNSDYLLGLTAEMIKRSDGYWLEIPEPPEER